MITKTISVIPNVVLLFDDANIDHISKDSQLNNNARLAIGNDLGSRKKSVIFVLKLHISH